ncbi:DNA polymerase beta superfamily protein [Polyangium fumosum]|uniref:UDP-phosphate N-acetylglucosaminyl 1-phosphate transferase n=1 Tax=Polyangium fumosum TaxID=889272 RepID=A0A4U1IVX2_9BACT|nr:nucleotidyltransferase domain-containing protein [Polyangium fumosum]TKC98549.1 UDP-phosphate N-acetylglucosaminyl 1-phosphate transferase [Polyangium fumosum]
MSRRLSGMGDVDPLAVPLPHGTEVTTRVDRTLGERLVPQGALGRVVGSGEGFFDVLVVGVGTVRYSREELVPRKVGQVRYARRREDAWSALLPCVVVDAVVGSRTWGLSDESSDEDRRGVFVLPFPFTTGLVEPPQDLVSEDGSRTYWEMGKAIRQALRADPNTLEMLFAAASQPASEKDPMGRWLVEARDAFVSVEIHASFGRYALSQLSRLSHDTRLAEHRAIVLGWLREDPTLGLDETAARLAKETQIVAPTPEDALLRAREYLKQLYRSMADQGLLEGREWAALAAYARAGESTLLPSPRELRPKNAYNLVRLIDLSIRWLRTGAPELCVRDELRPVLLDIKKGRVPLADVITLAESLTPELEAARRESKLPRRADVRRAEAVLRRVREEAARRFFEGREGPFGKDAAPAPEARWDE